MSKDNYTLPPMREETMKLRHKMRPILLVLLVTAVLIAAMVVLKPKEQKKEETEAIPSVEVIQVEPVDFVVPIKTDGTVLPQTKINISAEVNGRIIFVADNFINGHVFTQDDVLLKIDPTDYELAITRAKANVASQQANLDLQQAKSDLAKRDWKKYGKKGKPDALNLNLPQVASAKAAMSAAKADLKLAQRNLEKTFITAPFDGVLLAKMVDMGQFVSLGTPLASIASTEVAEVRISLSDEQMHNSGLDTFDGSQVIFVQINSDEIKDKQWQGKIASIEAQRDSKTLFNYAIIEVAQPFNQQNTPLRFNTFVNVSLEGKTLKQVYPLERGYVTLEDKVKVLSPKFQLVYKDIMVVYTDDDYKYISSGINANDNIITTGLSHIKAGDQLKRAN